MSLFVTDVGFGIKVSLRQLILNETGAWSALDRRNRAIIYLIKCPNFFLPNRSSSIRVIRICQFQTTEWQFIVLPKRKKYFPPPSRCSSVLDRRNRAIIYLIKCPNFFLPDRSSSIRVIRICQFQTTGANLLFYRNVKNNFRLPSRSSQYWMVTPLSWGACVFLEVKSPQSRY